MHYRVFIFGHSWGEDGEGGALADGAIEVIPDDRIASGNVYRLCHEFASRPSVSGVVSSESSAGT